MTPSKPEPFSGALELRNEHDALMTRVELALGAGEAAAIDEDGALRPLQSTVQGFVERAVATGERVEALEERSDCQALIDYWSTKLSRLHGGHALPQLRAFDERANPELPDESCPFVGAQPYAADGLFEGRRSETEAVLELVEKWPLVVVSGPSGSGKTSLVLAGVLPRLRAQLTPAGGQRWRVLDAVRPGPGLLADLARSAAAASGGDAAALERALAAGAGALARALGDPAAMAAVVTVDHADGLLAAAGQPALQAAVDALAQAAAAGHRVLLVLREEFEEQVLALPAFAPWRGLDADGQPRCGRLSVLPMTPAQLREAIVVPSEAAGLHLHAEVVDDLVNRLAGQRAALPLLQHAMVTLWQKKRRNRVAWKDYLQVRDALDAEKWRVEAEIQRAAAEREQAAARAKDKLAQYEQNRFRKTLLGLVGLALVSLGLTGWALHLSQEKNRQADRNKVLTQWNDDLEQKYAALRRDWDQNVPILAECQDVRAALRKGSVLVDAEFVRRAESQAARLLQCPPAGVPATVQAQPTVVAPAVRMPAQPALPAPGPVGAAGVAAQPVAQPATPPVAAAPPAPAAPASASALVRHDTWPPAMLALSSEDLQRRAQRLAFKFDKGQPARKVDELRRLHPLSWYWALSRWNDLKLRSPLALAVLFDTAIAHGPLQAATMRARAAVSDGSLPAERQLIEGILARRQALADTALLSKEDESRRVDALLQLIRQPDWALDAYATWGGG